MREAKTESLTDVHKQLVLANRLSILTLIRQGVRQKDLAAALEISESTLSRMFPTGVLQNIAQTSKITS